MVRVEGDHAEVRLPGQSGISTLRFDSLRGVLLSAPPDRWPELADRHLRIALDAGTRGAERPPVTDLLPRVGPVSTERSGATPWEESIVDGHLSLRLVVDLENAVRFVRPLDLAHWGIALSDAKAAAVDNLRARTPEQALEPFDEGVYRVGLADSYDATRVLLAEQWFPHHAGVLAILPARDVLFLVPVAGEEDVQRAGALWSQVATSADRLPYPISRQLFWFGASSGARAIHVTLDGELYFPGDLAALIDEQ